MLIAAPPVRAEAAPPVRAEAARRTVLIHLGGIAGVRHFDRWFADELVRQGVASESEVFDWTGGRPDLRALRDQRTNRRRAGELAGRIESILADSPDARIILSGHSGGSGVAVWALELLGKDIQIDALLLLAPALSFDYDLGPALSRTRVAHAWFSREDVVLLRVGTRVFGTIDGVHTDAAGLVGFHPPADADAALYARLSQHHYTHRDIAGFWTMIHFAPVMGSVVHRQIIPLLR